MKLWYVLVVILLSVSGCGKMLRPDSVIPASQANYPTAEFNACGKKWQGLGFCSLDEGKSYSDINFQIQGYHSGTIRVTSVDCSIDDDFIRYDGSQSIPFSIPGIAKKSCLISFVVSPEYPKEYNSGLVVNSLKGHLWISVGSPTKIREGFTSKVQEDADEILPLQVDAPGEYRVAFRGCETKYDKVHEVGEDKLIQIHLKDLLVKESFGVSSCIYAGGIEDSSKSVRYITWMVFGYDKKFVPLPHPVIVFEKENILIKADVNVSVISLDDDYQIDNEATFKKFDRTIEHTLRMITVGGRLLIGIWDAKKGEFKWI